MKRMTYGTAWAIFPSLPCPRQPDTEAPSRRAPEVHSRLGLAVDARRHTNPLPRRRASGMETI